MEETREMEQEIQQESDSFDTGLLERMNRIYEEREREYQKFYDQIRSREEELERIGTTLAVQKEEQEKKEAHLQEFEQSLKVIQERLEQRTSQLKQEEEALEQLTAEQRDQLEKEYQKLKQSKANAEIKQQIEINELRNQRIVLEREKGEVLAMKQKLSFGVPGEEDTKIQRLERQLAESAAQIEQLQRMIDQNEQERSGQESHNSQEAEEQLETMRREKEALEETVAQLQKEKGEQLRKIIDLNNARKKQEPLGAEQMEAYLKEQGDFDNVYILHAEDGDIVTSMRNRIHFRFAFKPLPFFDLCVQREENHKLKESIYALNARKPYKFSYDEAHGEAVLTGYFLPETSSSDLLHLALEAANCIAE